MINAFNRWVFLLALAALALQLFFALRIACMAVFDPRSTAFERAEVRRILRSDTPLRWQQRWVDYEDISSNLKRAVVASEDDGFTGHSGVEWDAVESAWKKNQRAASGENHRPAPVRGGSTITQQLAKNLFLSGERSFFRKGQELLLTFWLEVFLSKRRILEIYLNHVEWGEGVFGAEAAAQRYYGKPASGLTASEAARLAVMLPNPRHFEKGPQSAYVTGRAATIVRRMGRTVLPQ